MGYRVTAPYVTATLSDESGTESVRGFYAGGVLPSNVKASSAEILLAKGMVEKVATPQAKPEPIEVSLEDRLKLQQAEDAKPEPPKKTVAKAAKDVS